MQEYIINGLLIVVALLAVILQIIGTRPTAGMTKKQKVMLWRILTATVLLLILQVLGAGAFEVFGSAGRWVRLAVFLVDYLVIGYDILKKAGKGIRNGQVFDEHFLMAVATLGALALAVYENGDYLEAIAVMLFYQVGEWFQSYAVGKSRRNISDLMDIRPDYANIEREGKLEQVDPDEVGIGTIIVVQPGEKVPIDGTVVQGESTLNTAALTGESLPREVKTGDEIISGCINMTGLLHIQTTKEFGESTVSKILDLVENASSRKSKSEDFISRFAKIYTPAVCYAALALAVLPPLVRMFAMGLDAGWETWIYRGLTFLVAGCPCALVISIPLSFFAGIGGASKAGVLVKGSNYLETLSQAKIVVFDKTGTLTEGHPTVIAWLWAQCQEEYFKEVLLAAEMNSTNSLATAISTALREEGIIPARLDVCEVLKGKGMRVVYKDAEYWVGSHKLLKDYHVYLSDVLGDMLVEYESEGNSIVYFGRKNELLAIIAVKDQLKAAALGTVRELRASELDICMLTGDGERTASTIAGKLGIIRYMPDALPDDKETFIRELQLQGKMVVMIGDGINDVQALTCADVSIAMGENPDDATVEKTMVVMKSSDLQSLPKLFGLSRHTLRLMHQNSFWMVIYHLIGVLIAAGILYPVYGILLTPMLAAIVILLSCVTLIRS